MGKLYKLDHTGHGEVANWGDDAASRHAGTTAFNLLAERGFTMFDVTRPQDGKKIDAFDPEADEIIAVPRLQAG